MIIYRIISTKHQKLTLSYHEDRKDMWVVSVNIIMKKVLIKDCKYTTSRISNISAYCDVYIILDDSDTPLWHENLFLSDMAHQISINTLRNYANDLLSLSEMSSFLGGSLYINQSDITAYLHADLFQTRKYSLATMVRHISTLKKYLKWLSDKGYIDHFHSFNFSYKHLYKSEDVNGLHPDTISESLLSAYISKLQFKSLLENVSGENRFIRMRNKLVLKFGYFTGVRASEIHEFKAHNLLKKILLAKEENNGIYGTIFVDIIGKGNKRRPVRIPPNLCEDIEEFLRLFELITSNPKTHLFCKRNLTSIKDSKHASTVFTNAARRSALVQPLMTASFHRLRKTMATNAVEQCYLDGTNPLIILPRLLGHSKAKTSIKYIIFEALKNNRSNVLNDLAMNDAKYFIKKFSNNNATAR